MTPTDWADAIMLAVVLASAGLLFVPMEDDDE